MKNSNPLFILNGKIPDPIKVTAKTVEGTPSASKQNQLVVIKNYH